MTFSGGTAEEPGCPEIEEAIVAMALEQRSAFCWPRSARPPNSSAVKVKLLLPPRQSRGNSLRR